MGRTLMQKYQEQRMKNRHKEATGSKNSDTLWNPINRTENLQSQSESLSNGKPKSTEECTIDKSLHEARQAIYMNEFEKAKEILTSLRNNCSNTDVIKNMLAQVETSIAFSNFQKQYKQQIIAKAQKAIAIGDLDKAESLKLIAQRMDSDKKSNSIPEWVKSNKNNEKNATDSQPGCSQAGKTVNNNHGESTASIGSTTKEVKTDTVKEIDKLIQGVNGLGNFSKYSYNGPITGSLEQAEECIKKAQDKFVAQDLKKAESLLLKAERIYPTDRAKELLRKVQFAKANKQGGDIEKPVKKEMKHEEKPKQEEYVKPKPKEPTPEQIEGIKRVKEGKNDYEILGLERNTSLPVLNKTRRKLMQLLHPDRNKAPGAKDAFMTVKEAADRIEQQLNKA